MKTKTLRINQSVVFKNKSLAAINGFYITNPASMDFLLDQLYVKIPRSSYITLF